MKRVAFQFPYSGFSFGSHAMPMAMHSQCVMPERMEANERDRAWMKTNMVQSWLLTHTRFRFSDFFAPLFTMCCRRRRHRLLLFIRSLFFRWSRYLWLKVMRHIQLKFIQSFACASKWAALSPNRVHTAGQPCAIVNTFFFFRSLVCENAEWQPTHALAAGTNLINT